MMSPGTDTTSTKLAYATRFSEERTSDGSLRITVVSDRSQAMRNIAGITAISVATSVFLVALWYVGGSAKALVFGVTIGPIGAVLGGGMLLVHRMAPRTQTHVVEVGPAGLVVHTNIAGSPVVYRDALDTVIGVATDMGMEVHTVRRTYPCLQFVDRRHVKEIGRLVNEELAQRRGPRDATAEASK